MQLHLEERAVLPAPVERVWTFCADIRNMPCFRGYGPVPGIDYAVWRGAEPEAPCLGAVRDVHNRDGTTHVEEVVEYAPPRRLTDRVFGFSGPPRLWLRAMRDAFRFEPTEDGRTRLTRSVDIELRSAWLWPLGALTAFFLRRAFRRQHRAIAEALRGADAPC